MKLKPTTLAALAALSMDGIASADTTISYSSYVATGSTDTSWVNPVGYTSVKRVNFGGNDTNYGPNGETWLTGNVPQSFNDAAPIVMFYTAPNQAWGLNYQEYYPGGPNLLNQGVWNGSSGLKSAPTAEFPDGVDYRLDLYGFTVGQQYRVQFVLADSRGYFDSTVQIDGYAPNIDGQDSGTYQYAFADGKYLVVTASFTPGVGDTAFAFRPITNGGNMQINAIQVLTIADPFANWINEPNWPGLADRSAGGDPDNDGIKNLMEYILQGGDPSVSTTGTLPTLNASGANFVFTYFRRAAATGTTQTFEYGNNLIGWTPVAIPGGSGVAVTPGTPSEGIDKVEITVAKGTNTKLFGRLQVVK